LYIISDILYDEALIFQLVNQPETNATRVIARVRLSQTLQPQFRLALLNLHTTRAGHLIGQLPPIHNLAIPVQLIVEPGDLLSFCGVQATAQTNRRILN